MRKPATWDFWLLHVCLSVRMEQLGSQWTDFYKVWLFLTFQQSVMKMQVLLKSNKKNLHFTYGPIHDFDHILLNYF
jgi:hypothetical protein